MKGRKPGTPAPNKGKPHRPPSTTISVRLPVSLLEEAKAQAQGLGMTWNRFAVQAIVEAVDTNLWDGRTHKSFEEAKEVNKG